MPNRSLLEPSRERRNVFWRYDLNMRNGRLWRLERQFVVVQERMKYVLQIHAQIVVKHETEVPLFDERSVVVVQIVGHKNVGS